jgi:hypothetical protein
MAALQPLVMIAGQIQQAPAGSNFNGTMTGGENYTLTNGEASVALVIGMAVYPSSNDNVKRAEANASGTSGVIGLVNTTSIAAGTSGGVLTQGVISASPTQWQAVTDSSTGLTAGQQYWLSPTTPGNLTATAPTTAGQFVCPIGVALSTAELKINIQPTVGL